MKTHRPQQGPIASLLAGAHSSALPNEEFQQANGSRSHGLNLSARLRQPNRRHRRQSGSAVLVVFVLLAILGALIVSNNRILYALKQDLRLVEEKQRQKFAPAATATNAPQDAARQDR